MSSDSDDEHLERLKEATDTQFINDCMYKKSDNDEKIERPEEIKPLPSLRVKDDDEDNQFKFLKVTPEFQNYVAKALSKKLNKLIEYVVVEPTENNGTREVYDHVKLLRNSINPIDSKSSEADNNFISDSNKINAKRKRKAENNKYEVNRDELSAIAVSGDDILNRKGIEHWSTRSKAKIFKYKKDSKGVLHEIPEKFVSLS